MYRPRVSPSPRLLLDSLDRILFPRRRWVELRIRINLFRKMTQRMVVLVYLHERREIRAANFLRSITALGKRASGGKMRHVRRQTRDLVKLCSLFVGRVGHAFQKSFRIGVRRRRE